MKNVDLGGFTHYQTGGDTEIVKCMEEKYRQDMLPCHRRITMYRSSNCNRANDVVVCVAMRVATDS